MQCSMLHESDADICACTLKGFAQTHRLGASEHSLQHSMMHENETDTCARTLQGCAETHRGASEGAMQRSKMHESDADMCACTLQGFPGLCRHLGWVQVKVSCNAA